MSEQTPSNVKIARLRACEASIAIIHWLLTVNTPTAIALRVNCLSCAFAPEIIGNPTSAQLAAQYGVSRQWVDQLIQQAKDLLRSR